MPGVSDSFLPLIVATVAFVASHFVLSATPVRGRLVRAASEPVFLIGYSLVAFATFGWMCVAYARAPFEDLWGDPLWARWLAVLVMPLATVLLVAGLSTANPATVGMGRLLAEGRSPVGIQKVSRHPMMVALALWAALHLLANGDEASLILFGGMLVLALGGIAHIEARRRAIGGANWQRFAAASSVVPFAAIAAGRARVTLGEIGWNRIAAGIVLYFILLFGHRLVIDVPLLPGLFRH